MERHVHDLPFDLRQSSGVAIPQEEDPALTVRMIASISLLAITLPSVAHDLRTPTLGTLDFYNSHILSCSMVLATGIVLV